MLSLSLFHDFLRRLACLRRRRLWNAALLWVSYHAARLLKKDLHFGRPLSISLEPTTACNLRCPECPSGLRAFTRPTGRMKSDFFRQTIDALHRHLFSVVFYFQGEPFIHPEFLDMVAYARQKGIYTLTSTNAHFLTDDTARRTVESGLDRIIISVDGSTQEVYEQYRIGGSLERVKTGVQNLVRWKRTLRKHHPFIEMQFLVLGPNEHQIPDIKALARELGVDQLRLKSAQIYDYANGTPLIPSREKYARYRRLPNGQYALKRPTPNRCWRMWRACVITWDGLVVPCCFDKDAQHPMGDLKLLPFDQIWKGQAYANFRQQLLRNRQSIDICTNCTEC